MFAGGFVGALILGKSMDEAVEIGHRTGAMCVGQVCRLFLAVILRLIWDRTGRTTAQVAERKCHLIETIDLRGSNVQHCVDRSCSVLADSTPCMDSTPFMITFIQVGMSDKESSIG